MARPKDPVEKSYQFHSRLTPGEGAAVEEMVRRWAAENPLTPGDRTTWFRTIVRREAEKMKIAIVEPGATHPAPVEPEPAAKPAAKPAKKRRP